MRRALAAASLGLAVAAAATAGEPRVRVLVLETAEPVHVGTARGSLTTVAPAGTGLQAGSRKVGPVWRLEGALLRLEHMRLRGEIEVQRVPQGLRVVNRVPLEDYVAGTLGREVYTAWAPETLKAQAVVARTYALHEAQRHASEPFDLAGNTGGQVYGGVDAEAPAVVAATRATRGEYLTWQGQPILAVYHSASGGRTASSEEVWGSPLPYLLSRPVEDEQDSPDTYWRTSLARTKLGRALAPLGVRVGPLRELRVSARWPSGRARTVRVRGRDGVEEIEARALRDALGAQVIRSTLFEVRNTDDAVVFVGSGHGHGVGMSQWGAQAMARGGASYREILSTFYPGTELRSGGLR